MCSSGAGEDEKRDVGNLCGEFERGRGSGGWGEQKCRGWKVVSGISVQGGEGSDCGWGIAWRELVTQMDEVGDCVIFFGWGSNGIEGRSCWRGANVRILVLSPSPSMNHWPCSINFPCWFIKVLMAYLRNDDLVCFFLLFYAVLVLQCHEWSGLTGITLSRLHYQY